MAKAIFVDFARCINCHACEVACERGHYGLPNLFVTLPTEGFAAPITCRHCDKSPCLAVCPTGALSRGEHEAVILEADKCTGCKLCAFACPFGVIGFDPSRKVITKCDLCLPRLAEDKPPACVATCPARALRYDEYEAFTARVKRQAAVAGMLAALARAGAR